MDYLARESTRPTLPRLAPLLFIAEMLVIVLAGLYATSAYRNFDPSLRIGGDEAEYHTMFSYTVSEAWHTQGYIPLWRPLMELGDTNVDNPFSYILNPIAIAPSLFYPPYDSYNMTKLTIIISVIVTGLGGWALARILGLGMLGRLVLALLMVGRGNLHAQLYPGFLQLFESQVFFPWIFAGLAGILRGFRRWPVVLVALAFTLEFWSGIAWFPPALMLIIAILVLVYAFDIRKQEGKRRFIINWPIILQVGAAAVVTVGLASITLIPLVSNRDNIGHSPITTEFTVDVGIILQQYYSGVKDIVDHGYFPPGQAYAFYSFVMPLWFGAVILALLVIIFLARRKLPALPWRFLLASALIVIFCTLWAAGQNPIVELLYQLSPFFSQFRHVERVLAIPSIWIGVMVAICVDGLWFHFVTQPLWANIKWIPKLPKQQLGNLAAVALIGVSGFSSYQVIDKWHEKWGSEFLQSENGREGICISWLRQNNPDKELSVWTANYKVITTYLRNNVRHANVASDFYHAASEPSTVYNGDLTQMPAEYALDDDFEEHTYLKKHAYVPIPESSGLAQPYDAPCLYRWPGALSYAFLVNRDNLNANPGTLPKNVTTPITSYKRNWDWVAVVATGSDTADIVLTVQERDYPGWVVQMDGVPAKLESVGGFVGIILPRDGKQHEILFQYKPIRLYIGAVITLFTWTVCVLFLLRVDLLIRKRLFPKTRTDGS